MQKKNIGYLFAGLAVLELAFLPIISSIGGSSLGAIPLLFFTFLTASIVSFALLAYKKRTAELLNILSDRRALAIVLVAGLLNYAVAQLFLTFGVLGTNPVITSIVLKLWPIFMALMLPFTLKTGVKVSQLVALLLGFLGVYILATSGTLGLGSSTYLLIPMLFLIVYDLSTASSNIIIRAHNYDMYVQVFLFNLVSFVLFAGLLGLGGSWTAFSRINASGVISFLFLGGITYSLGAFMYFYALKTLNPLFAPTLGYATPFITILFSVILLGTRLYVYYFAALALLLLALIIQQRQAAKAPRYIHTKKYASDLFLFDVTGALVNSRGEEISRYIRGSGRALAASVNRKQFFDRNYKLLNSNECIIFTSDKPHPEILEEEMDFIKSTMSVSDDELVIIGVGNEERVEEALNQFASSRAKAGSPS